MKTIFRFTKLGLLLAAILSVGAVAGFAQNPCEDAEGQVKLQDEYDKLWAERGNVDIFKNADPQKVIDTRKKAIASGRSFIEKYGACEPTKERTDWLKAQIPNQEATVQRMEEAVKKKALVDRFNNALKTSNWDETYSAGQEVLAKYGDEFRAVELVLGSIGYDELLEKNNPKYVDQTLSFAKQAMASLESGKDFKGAFGAGRFTYNSKEHAVAWMNLTLGSLYQMGKKDKTTALPYLYKATQAPAGTDVAKNPNPYEFIGSYYFDELNKVVAQIKAAEASQSETDTQEVAQKKVDDIKALVAMANGIAERAMDAFARAYTLGVNPAYKKKMKDNVLAAAKVRGKEQGMDQWIAAAVAKPFVNPTTPVQPISDPEPTTTKTDGGTTSLGAANGSGVGAANGTGVGAANGNGVGKPSGSAVAPKPITPPVKKPGNKK